MITVTVPRKEEPKHTNPEDTYREDFGGDNYQTPADMLAEIFGLKEEKKPTPEKTPVPKFLDQKAKESLAKAEKREAVDHPSHYTYGGIETIDFIEAKKLGFNLGNVVKYVTRAGKKDDVLEDLKKARWYLDREIANLSK